MLYDISQYITQFTSSSIIVMLFNDAIELPIEDGHIIYYPNLFNSNEALAYFDELLNTIDWQQDTISLFGKTHYQPRLTALYADNNNPYTYSNITMQPKIFIDPLRVIKKRVEQIAQVKFTSCLANLYRNGNDSNGWHADNEKELGIYPIIASVSFGAERFFHLKHRSKKNLRYKIKLEQGSLLIMKGTTQHYWLHQIPKTKKVIGPRINLTFRIIA